MFVQREHTTRTVWDVLFDANSGLNPWDGTFGGPQLSQQLGAPPRTPGGTAAVIRRKMAAAARAELQADRLADKYIEICKSYGELMDAAYATHDSPGTQCQVHIGPASRGFRHVVAVDVFLNDVPVVSTELIVELELQVSAAITVAEGAIVAMGAGTATAEATLLLAEVELTKRQREVDLSRLLYVEGHIPLLDLAFPRQTRVGPTE